MATSCEVSVGPLDAARAKLKELNQALNVIEEVEERVSWASDFASYVCINHALDPIYDTASQARDKIEEEIEYIENQIEEFEFKQLQFEKENAIDINE
jgi:hypothetical protein